MFASTSCTSASDGHEVIGALHLEAMARVIKHAHGIASQLIAETCHRRDKTSAIKIKKRTSPDEFKADPFKRLCHQPRIVCSVGKSRHISVRSIPDHQCDAFAVARRVCTIRQRRRLKWGAYLRNRCHGCR